MAEDEVTYDEDEAYLAVTMTISLATKPSTAAGHPRERRDPLPDEDLLVPMRDVRIARMIARYAPGR